MTLLFHAHDDVLVVVFSGELPKDLDELTDRYFKTVKISGFKKVLVDLRRIEKQLSPPDSYLYSLRLSRRHRVPRCVTAMVEAEMFKSAARFHNLVLRNIGYNPELFFDYDEALAWLRAA